MEPEKKTHVKLDTESIKDFLELPVCIDMANKIDDMVMDLILSYVDGSAENGYATDEEIKEYFDNHKFELLRSVYGRGDI